MICSVRKQLPIVHCNQADDPRRVLLTLNVCHCHNELLFSRIMFCYRSRWVCRRGGVNVGLVGVIGMLTGFPTVLIVVSGFELLHFHQPCLLFRWGSSRSCARTCVFGRRFCHLILLTTTLLSLRIDALGPPPLPQPYLADSLVNISSFLIAEPILEQDGRQLHSNCCVLHTLLYFHRGGRTQPSRYLIK